MVVNDYVCGLNKYGVLVFFASELAPTRVFKQCLSRSSLIMHPFRARTD